MWPFYLLGGTALAAFSTAAVRADKPPMLQLEASRKAIAAAISVDAAEWAPDVVEAARDSLRAASREIDRQIARVFAVRDYDTARLKAAHALRLAREAITVAAVRRDTAKAVALDRMKKAGEELQAARQSMGYVQLDGYSRAKLVRLELLRQEAFLAAGQGKYRLADQKARAAIAGAEAIQQAVDERLEDYQQNQRLWAAWAQETIDWSRRNQSYALLVRKLDHRCDVYHAGKLKVSFPAELGIRWMGHKQARGDNATPEGRYHIIKKKRASRYYKALEINYPNEDDRRRFQLARQKGRISQSLGIGGLIEIHGSGGRGSDWTQGCVALSNDHMDKLFTMAEVGTPVTIVGDWDGSFAGPGVAR